jgi:hypothetical protein
MTRARKIGVNAYIYACNHVQVYRLSIFEHNEKSKNIHVFYVTFLSYLETAAETCLLSALF